MSATDGKEDKYEQLLAKIDWRAPHPPKGYQYGAGRGAKGFVTTAELATVGATGAKMTREENDFFSAMERLEEGGRNRGRRNKADDDHADAPAGKAEGSSAAPATKVKLSLDDLATLEVPPASNFTKSSSSTGAAASAGADVITASADPTATSATTAAAQAPSPASSLVVRSARTEEGDAAEEHVFAEERVLTAYDVLKGKASAVQAGLHNVLAMGSTEDQTTWITHARAYREMGMTRRAYQTLVEGCAVTGKKGKRIWEERLRYLAKDNLGGRRRLLEEATSACPSEEELWTLLLDVVPPLERIPCLQRAVMACPSSEQLWLKLVQFVPSTQDQRVLLQRALQHTPHLPLLWARLARLETLKTGKEMFQAAAARFPSLALIIEAAKYVEWYTLTHWASAHGGVASATTAMHAGGAHQDVTPRAGSTEELYAALRHADAEVGGLVRTAQQNYLNLGEAGSRHTWLTTALSLLHAEDRVPASAGEAALEESRSEGSAAPAPLSSPLLSQSCVYVCTAAHMFLSVVDPNHKGFGANAVPATWMSDLIALFPAEATAQHEVQCALWYTWVLLQRHFLDTVAAVQNAEAATAEEESTFVPPPVPGAASAREALPTLKTAVLSAPRVVVHCELLPLLQCAPAEEEEEEKNWNAVRRGDAEAQNHRSDKGGENAEKEEEEEELGTLSAPAAAGKQAVMPVTGAAPAQEVPAPLLVTVAATVGLTTHAASLFAGCATSAAAAASHRVLLCVDVPLTLSEALYRHGCYTAALAVVDRMLPSSTAASSSAGVLDDASEQAAAPAATSALSVDLRLYVARAELLSALGDAAGADRCVLGAINAAAAQRLTNPSQQEVAWVKLAVLRRSQGQVIETILHDALAQCPRSWRLWLMLLEERRRVIDAHQRTLRESLLAARHSSSSSSAAGARPATMDLSRMDDSLATEVREVRALCKKALAADHCRTVAAVWIFAAQRIEAELLQNVPAARALLTDASSACAAAIQSTRSHLLARALSPQESEQQASAFAQIGVALARLDAHSGAPGQALETVQEVLQRLPKTRDGTFTLAQDSAVGELLSLFIALEPPASRGRAAAQVMRQWKSREPLALCAVAQLYFTAGQGGRALDQAVKAVEASRGRCGDAVGLLWRMADQSVMHAEVRKLLPKDTAEENVDAEDGSDRKAGADGTAAPASGPAVASELSADVVQKWVLGVMTSAASAAAIGISNEVTNTLPAASLSLTTGSETVSETVVPNCGPLWISVAKAEDPTNVLIRGYRRSVVEMLREVANRTALVGPESVKAAPLREN